MLFLIWNSSHQEISIAISVTSMSEVNYVPDYGHDDDNHDKNDSDNSWSTVRRNRGWSFRKVRKEKEGKRMRRKKIISKLNICLGWEWKSCNSCCFLRCLLIIVYFRIDSVLLISGFPRLRCIFHYFPLLIYSYWSSNILYFY